MAEGEIPVGKEVKGCSTGVFQQTRRSRSHPGGSQKVGRPVNTCYVFVEHL